MGKVFLVGAGPGPVDLLTIRAARLLARADIVFHDALIEPEVLAFAPQAILIAVGKRCGAHAASQRFINKRLIDAAARHAVVVRLKGGDPMIFGRAQEEIDALRAAGIDVEIVSGVTAAVAAAADVEISLTRRSVARSLALVTPRTGDGEAAHAWAHAAAAADTAAIYMGAGQAEAVVSGLTAHGVPLSRPVVLIENASRPDRAQHAGTLGELPQLAALLRGGPALIIVGEVARGRIAAGVVAAPRQAVAG